MQKIVFDIGATNTKYALMTPEGEILERRQMPTDYSSADAFYDALARIAKEHMEAADAIAVSTCGRMQQDGLTYRAYVRPVLKGTNFKKEMAARCPLPVTVLNDGSAAALGEWQYGAGRGCRNLMTLVLGSGAGAGLILNGELYEGNRLNASAVFNMLCGYDGKSYQLAGIATSMVVALYQAAAAKGIPFTDMTGERFFDLAGQGDPIALGLLEEYCRGSATLIYNAATLLDLDRVVVTGSLTRQPLVLEGINRKLREIAESYHSQIAQVPGAAELLDLNDCSIQAVQGELTADANLYGALYHNLQSMQNP